MNIFAMALEMAMARKWPARRKDDFGNVIASKQLHLQCHCIKAIALAMSWQEDLGNGKEVEQS